MPKIKEVARVAKQKRKQTGKLGRRRTTYKEWITKEGLLKISGWAKDGLVNEQIAANIGIHPSTLYDWQNKHPEIDEALKKGKEIVDRQVENALLKRALGYKFEETTRESVRNPETGKKKMVVTKIVTKDVQPDVTAQIFWLKNRKPDMWRDRKELEHHGTVGVTMWGDPDSDPDQDSDPNQDRVQEADQSD